jgi:hypothetical protein
MEYKWRRRLLLYVTLHPFLESSRPLLKQSFWSLSAVIFWEDKRPHTASTFLRPCSWKAPALKSWSLACRTAADLTASGSRARLDTSPPMCWCSFKSHSFTPSTKYRLYPPRWSLRPTPRGHSTTAANFVAIRFSAEFILWVMRARPLKTGGLSSGLWATRRYSCLSVQFGRCVRCQQVSLVELLDRILGDRTAVISCGLRTVSATLTNAWVRQMSAP